MSSPVVRHDCCTNTRSTVRYSRTSGDYYTTPTTSFTILANPSRLSLSSSFFQMSFRHFFSPARSWPRGDPVFRPRLFRPGLKDDNFRICQASREYENESKTGKNLHRLMRDDDRIGKPGSQLHLRIHDRCCASGCSPTRVRTRQLITRTTLVKLSCR